MPVKKFNRYEIREELGIGGMATVYRAYDPLFEREVAVKVMKKELLENDQLRERFERETKIIAKLEHAAIVPVHDVGFDHDQLFYVMRYMTGNSLADRIEAGTLTLNQVAHIIMRVSEALDYAHKKGIVHRDLKPGNILFDEINNAFISDFGIAKIAQGSTKITNSGILGTPRYMSPEQARGETADGRSDQYSLAVMVFEMLSGRAPFEATTPLGLAFKHATEPAPNILNINPKLPSSIGRVIKKALQKEPKNRYRNCVEFARAFLDALTDSNGFDLNSVTPLPAMIYSKSESPTELPWQPAQKPRLGNRLRLAVEFVIVILLGLMIWGYPRLTAAIDVSSPTPETATATTIPTTPTQIPPTVTATPTEIIEPTVPAPDPGIGGATNIALTANRDIYLMDMDGGNITQLTNTNLQKFDLQWLPGGEELLYGEGNCVYRINVESPESGPERIGCFNDENFDGFRVSPDGKHVAITISRRLIILPFDLELLSTAKSAFELQSSEEVCIDYTDVSVRGAQWSSDGKSLAVLYQSVVGQRIGETIRVMEVNLIRCQDVDPLFVDEFPGRRFVPEGYDSLPLIPSYNWDGGQRFIFNTFIRNSGYGELYLYDVSTNQESWINPVDGDCCYRSGTFSPDGTYILFAFQDIGQGADSETNLYYIPVDQLGTETNYRPLRLPFQFFPDIRENILVALRRSTP